MSKQLVPVIAIVNDQPRTMSTNVAEFFDKNHKDVLRQIRSIVDDSDPEFARRNFTPSEYMDSTGRTLPCFSLTRDGFTLLAMGFTGEEALKWKIKYIEAFNSMEAELSQRPKRPRPQSQLDRRFTAGLYKDMAKLKAVPDEMKTVFMAKAIEIMTDEPVNALLPRITDGRETWLSPTDIGKRMGVNRNVVGRALTALGLHGDNDPGHEWSHPVWNKAQGHNKEVKSYLYDPAIIPQIEDYLTTPRPATAEPRPHFSVVG